MEEEDEAEDRGEEEAAKTVMLTGDKEETHEGTQP